MVVSGCLSIGSVRNSSEISPDEAGRLILIAEKSFFAAGIGLIPIIDGKEAYVLDQNQYVILYIPQGEHTIAGKLATRNQQATNESVMTISSKIGETVCLRFVLHQPSRDVIYATVTQISEEQALQSMQDATRIGAEQALPVVKVDGAHSSGGDI